MRQKNSYMLSELITDERTRMLLRWAVKKTGSRQDGEDLAQEVMLQVCIAASRGTVIREPEHFIWKVAHHCWCNYLRKTKKVNEIMPLDESVPEEPSIIDRLVEDDSLRSELSFMRRRIADLSYQQRESMLLYYLDGLSVRQVAERLGISDSSVKKHLFDARKKVKKEMGEMKTDTEYVYRPGKLVLGVSGEVPEDPDTVRVNDNLVRQNLLLLCTKEPKKIDELAELTGIPKPYLEPELAWLTEREFLSFETKKYTTIIPVIGRNHYRNRGDIYVNGAGRNLIDVVLSGLAAKEDVIRDIGFFGAGWETGRLLWPLLMLFISYFSRNSETALRLKRPDEREIRPDGGRYMVIGNDLSEGWTLDTKGYENPEGWTEFYGIVSDGCRADVASDSFYWLGLYTFACKVYHPGIVSEENVLVKKAWHSLYCRLIEPDFTVESLTADEKEMLADSVSGGFVTKAGDNYTPQFVIMTSEQLEQLQEKVFEPLLTRIEPELKRLTDLFSGIHKKNLPKITRNHVDFLTYLDLWNFGFYTYITAAAEGVLQIPASPEEGARLTLVLVR